MRYILILISLFIFLSGRAQVIEGTVYSGSSSQALRKVKVRIGNRSTKTDKNGYFSLPLKKGEPLGFYHSRYDTYSMPPDRILLNDTNEVYLNPTSNLYTMVLEGDAPETVRSNDFEHVFDYTFLEDTLVVLSYFNWAKPKYKTREKIYKNCAMTLFHRGAAVAREIIPDKTFRLYRDPFNRLFLELSDACFQVIRSPGNIRVDDFPLDEYLTRIAPLSGVSTTGFFFIRRYSYFPDALLVYYDPDADRFYTLYNARNKNYFQKVNADFVMLSTSEIKAAKELASQSNLDYKLYSTYLRSFYMLRDVDQPKVAGFMLSDHFLFFDMQNNLLQKFSSSGKLLESNDKIYFDELLREDFVKLIQDPLTADIYSQTDKSGVSYIRKINPETGATGLPFKLEQTFVKKVKIFAGYVYNIHESPVTDTKAELLRQKLPF